MGVVSGSLMIVGAGCIGAFRGLFCTCYSATRFFRFRGCQVQPKYWKFIGLLWVV